MSLTSRPPSSVASCRDLLSVATAFGSLTPVCRKPSVVRTSLSVSRAAAEASGRLVSAADDFGGAQGRSASLPSPAGRSGSAPGRRAPARARWSSPPTRHRLSLRLQDRDRFEAASEAASRSPRRRCARAYCTSAWAAVRCVSRPFQVRGKAVEVVDFALGEVRDHVEAAGVLELAREAGREVAEEGLRLDAGLLREVLGPLRALRAQVREDRRADSADGKHDADRGDLARADQRAARGRGALALLLPAPSRSLRAPRARAARRGCP